jgi:transglutaminase-like putative cysteine protease
MSVVEAARKAREESSEVSARTDGLDASSLSLWSAAVLVAAMALPAANWTDGLGYVPVTAAAGLVLGVLLVVSRFRGMTAVVLGLGYGLALILWQLTTALDLEMAWRERVLDLAARVATFISVVLAGEPSHDSLMFVLAMMLTFWAIAAFGTWWLFRRGGLWLAVLLPGVAVFLNVYYYRYGTRLQIYLPVFLLAALALVVRTELIRRRSDWQERRAQVSTDVSSRVTQAGIVAALLLVLASWLGPHVPDAQLESSSGVTGSRSPLNEFFSDALAGLRAPVNLYGETFASTLVLGAGRPPGNRVVFEATSPGVVPDGSRVYWRARAYDTYRDRTWEVALGETTDYRPREGEASDAVYAGRVDFDFSVSTFLPAMKLLFLPAEIAWVNRSAELLEVSEAGDVVDVLQAHSAETLLPGDSYRGRSRLAAPLAGDLQQAGTDYPDWVADAYLQLPADLPQRVERLAREITVEAPTPYDKAQAITSWLRANMTYDREVAAPAEDRDPVDWFLFDSRTGFCDYYASAAVLMLRSLGVPSRLAAGYASGEYDAETGEYVVSEADLHSWPEVYFPGYGWVEFEPTVSQPPLERAAGASGAAGSGGALPEEDAGADGSAAEGLPFDPFGRLEDVEDIQIPEAPVPPTPWLAYLLIGFVLVAGVVYVTPARRAVAQAVVAGAKRVGRSAPSVVEEWAAEPASEAAGVFRRLAPWPGRLGVPLDRDATPTERAQAAGEVIPELDPAFQRIADAYSAERYGGIAPVQGEVSRDWRSVRPGLYRAWLLRLINLILPNESD